jgi:hypothetical protein
MLRAAEMLGGGILGIGVGFFLCAPVIAHVFAPTTVTWDATACPAGVYTITSTATSQGDSRSFTTTTQNIPLPMTSIEQVYSELPAGQYQVTAVATDANGRRFDSGVQTVVATDPILPPILPPNPPTPPIPAIPDLPTVVASRRNRGHQEPGAAAAPAIAGAMRLSVAVLDQLAAGAGPPEMLAAFPRWKSIAIVDSDEDGEMDTVRIELVTGEVWFASLGH